MQRKRMSKKELEERVKIVVDLAAKEKHVDFIIEKSGLSRRSIISIAKKRNITVIGINNWNDYKIQRLKEKVAAGETAEDIADALNVTVPSVYWMGAKVGLSLKKEMTPGKYYSATSVAKKCGIDDGRIYTAINNGRLKARKQKGFNCYFIKIHDIRRWLFDNMVKSKCWSCGAVCGYDIYCEKHRPEDMKSFVVLNDTYTSAATRNDLCDTFKQIMKDNGVSVPDLASASGFQPGHTMALVNKRTKDLSLQQIESIANGLNFEVQIVFKRKK